MGSLPQVAALGLLMGPSILDVEVEFAGVGTLELAPFEDGIYVLYDGENDRFVIQRVEGALVDTAVTAAVSFGDDDTDYTLSVSWSGAELTIKLNDDPIVVESSTTSPQGTLDSEVDFGNRDDADQAAIDIYWWLITENAPTEAAQTLLDALGNTDPVWQDHSEEVHFAFLWPGADETHDPLSNRAGESNAN